MVFQDLSQFGSLAPCLFLLSKQVQRAFLQIFHTDPNQLSVPLPTFSLTNRNSVKTAWHSHLLFALHYLFKASLPLSPSLNFTAPWSFSTCFEQTSLFPANGTIKSFSSYKAHCLCSFYKNAEAKRLSTHVISWLLATSAYRLTSNLPPIFSPFFSLPPRFLSLSCSSLFLRRQQQSGEFLPSTHQLALTPEKLANESVADEKEKWDEHLFINTESGERFVCVCLCVFL